MASPLAGETQLDKQIATLQSQIQNLQHHRSLLTHTFLSSRKFQQSLSTTTPSPTLSASTLSTVRSLTEDHATTTTTNLHRTFGGGITAFRIQDPDPNAVDEGKVLGIRFDIFSVEKSAFQTPYYVLLNEPRGRGVLRVHKHTVPVCIPLSGLVARYLPYKASNNDDDQSEDPDIANLEKLASKQDLPKFARALRGELVAHHKRLEAVAMLKRELGRRERVVEVKMLDVTGKEVQIVFADKMEARVLVGTDGGIERASVGPHGVVGLMGDAEAMKGYRALKKAILGGDGRLDSLHLRLRQRSSS